MQNLVDGQPKPYTLNQAKTGEKLHVSSTTESTAGYIPLRSFAVNVAHFRLAELKEHILLTISLTTTPHSNDHHSYRHAASL